MAEKKADIDHDALFKQLIKRFYIEFLELFFSDFLAGVLWSDNPRADKETIRKNAGQRKQKRKFSDLVFHARDRISGSQLLVHIEVQERNKDLDDFPRRMFVYFSRLVEEYKLPVFPIVLFSFEQPVSAQPDEYVLPCRENEVVSFKYKVVQLNNLRWQDYVGMNNPIAVALSAKMRIAREDRAVVKWECLKSVQLLGVEDEDKRLIMEFVETYLDLEPFELEMFEQFVLDAKDERGEVIEMVTSWERKGIARGIARGRSEGIAEGKAEGKAEGIAEGKAVGIREGQLREAFLLNFRILRKKLGDSVSGMEEQLKNLSLEDLEELSEDLLDFASIDDLKLWLSRKRR